MCTNYQLPFAAQGFHCYHYKIQHLWAAKETIDREAGADTLWRPFYTEQQSDAV